MYALVFALFALWPMRAGAATVVLGAFGLGVAALGLVTLLRAGAATEPVAFFVGGRLSEPLGYPNGNVALWFSGVIPCVFLAARREVPPPIRGLALGGAALLVDLALLGQSRGWLFTLPAVIVLFLTVAPGRARNAVAAVAVAAASLVSLGPVLNVFDGIDAELDVAPLLADATRAILLSAGALLVLGIAAGYADRSIAISPRASRRASAAVFASLVLGAIVTLAVVSATHGNPVAKVSDAWDQFRAPESEADDDPGAAGSRFTSTVGQSRYDFWRVAWDEFQSAPLRGVGADNYQQDYLRLGTSTERPRYPHSVELRALAQTGIVGAALLGGALVAGLVAGLGAAWRRPGLPGAAAGAATATFLYWAVHGSVDWFWELPALGAPAFAALGLAASLAPRAEAPSAPGRRFGSGQSLVHGPARVAVAIVIACLLAISLVLPWLAYRDVDRALKTWPSRPVEARDRLDRAADLNPLSAQPDVTAGAIALRLGRPYTAQRAYGEALERSPRSAFARLQLGALASQLGRPDDAQRLLREAADLNPRDEITSAALERVGTGEPLDAGSLFDEARERALGIAGGG
jgi:tetratricopeptide (TPR) repeat protein